MYIPNELLEWQLSLGFFVLLIPLWILAFIKSSNKLKSKLLPIICLGTVFSFTVLIINVPFVGELPGRIIGATILSIIFGPAVSFITTSLALAIHSIFLNNGGINSLAANSFILALTTSFTGYYIYKHVFPNKSVTIRRKILAAGIGGYFSSIAAALTMGLILELQVILNYMELGVPLAFPNIIRKLISTILIEHLLILGLIEAALTAVLVFILTRDNSYLLNLINKNNELEPNY